MSCGYCGEEITDKEYTWKWFPDQMKFLPVHPIHLSTRRGKTPNEIQAEVDKGGGSTGAPGRDEIKT